jgi:hypothetical protein
MKEKTLTELLKAKIRATGLSISAFSRKVDIPTTVLSKFMSEDPPRGQKKHKTLQLPTVERLMDYFGLEVREKGK